MIFLRRVMKAGWQSFKRNVLVSSTAILILIITLSLITGVMLFNTMTNQILDALRDRVSIGVYFANNAPENQILQFKASLEQAAGVKSVEYVSRQEALENFRATHKDDETINEALDKLGGQNPLPPSLTIKADRTEDYPAIVDFVQKSEYKSIVYDIDYVKRQDAINNLGQISGNMSQIAIIAVAMMALISFLVSFNTLRLAIYNDRQKIAIMRLVGASNNFVRGPFIIQGIIYGVSSAFFTLFFFAILLQIIDSPVESYFRNLYPLELATYYANNWLKFFGIQLFLGVAIGVASSIIAIRRYLKV